MASDTEVVVACAVDCGLLLCSVLVPLCSLVDAEDETSS